MALTFNMANEEAREYEERLRPECCRFSGGTRTVARLKEVNADEAKAVGESDINELGEFLASLD